MLTGFLGLAIRASEKTVPDHITQFLDDLLVRAVPGSRSRSGQEAFLDSAHERADFGCQSVGRDVQPEVIAESDRLVGLLYNAVVVRHEHAADLL
jgi:hypothetical protein